MGELRKRVRELWNEAPMDGPLGEILDAFTEELEALRAELEVVKARRLAQCPHCKGACVTERIGAWGPCESCNGAGLILVDKGVTSVSKIPMTREPCPRCLGMALLGLIDAEMLQCLPQGAFAPRAHDESGRCCFDCASADGLAPVCGSFEAARVAVGTDRMHHYRTPPGMKLGLVLEGRVRLPTETLDEHHAWLDEVMPGWSENTR